MIKQTRLLMGMPITLEVIDPAVTLDDVDKVFAYFAWVDETFSTYKPSSEISQINRGALRADQYSEAMRQVLALSEQTKRESHGYFDIVRDGHCDPAGIVKGWAVHNAACMLSTAGLHHYYIDAGGDIQLAGTRDGAPWRVGIRNPFDRHQIVKVLSLTDRGVATSGTAVRGQHIYNPFHPSAPLREIVSITIIGPNVLEADRFATAAFAMGRAGIQFVEALPDFEGYMIDADARATYTSGFERYVVRAC